MDNAIFTTELITSIFIMLNLLKFWKTQIYIRERECPLRMSPSPDPVEN